MWECQTELRVLPIRQVYNCPHPLLTFPCIQEMGKGMATTRNAQGLRVVTTQDGITVLEKT